MAKYSGFVGYAKSVETSKGVWTEVITDRKVRGDVIRLGNSVDSADKVNDDITLQNRISLVADPYSYDNFTEIRYITYLGSKWKVTGIEVQRPRLILSIGGIWNE